MGDGRGRAGCLFADGQRGGRRAHRQGRGGAHGAWQRFGRRHRRRDPRHQRARRRAGAAAGGPTSWDGTQVEVAVVGTDPLSDLAVLRTFDSVAAAAVTLATPTGSCRPARGRVGNPLGLTGSVTAGRRQRAGPSAAGATRRGGTGGRGRDPDRRGAESGKLRRRARRLAAPGWSGSTPPSPASASGSPSRSTRPPGGSWTPDRATAGCAAPTWGSSGGRRRCRPRSPTGTAGSSGCGSPRCPRRAGRGRRACIRATSSDGAAAGGDAQDIQRQLFATRSTPLPVTVLRNGAMVDVVALPTELP